MSLSAKSAASFSLQPIHSCPRCISYGSNQSLNLFLPLNLSQVSILFTTTVLHTIYSIPYFIPINNLFPFPFCLLSNIATQIVSEGYTFPPLYCMLCRSNTFQRVFDSFNLISTIYRFCRAGVPTFTTFNTLSQ